MSLCTSCPIKFITSDLPTVPQRHAIFYDNCGHFYDFDKRTASEWAKPVSVCFHKTKNRFIKESFWPDWIQWMCCFELKFIISFLAFLLRVI